MRCRGERWRTQAGQDDGMPNRTCLVWVDLAVRPNSKQSSADGDNAGSADRRLRGVKRSFVTRPFG